MDLICWGLVPQNLCNGLTLMSYDYYSQNSRKYNKQPNTMARRIKLAAIFVLLIVGIIIVINKFKHHPEWSEALKTYQSSFQAWLSDRKQKLHQTVATVQHEVDEGNGEPPAVKFEFYNTLQDMQAMQAKPTPKFAENKPVLKPQTEKPKLGLKSKSSAHADLEQDILSTMKKSGGN